jgi:formylglycine-generating enzyme required for sulfatase activity
MAMAFVLLAASPPSSPAAESQDLDEGVVNLVVKYRGVRDDGSIDEGKRVGSGFVVRCDEESVYILTAYHVIKDSQETGVIFSSQRHASPLKPRVIHQQFQDENGLALLAVPADAARSAGARGLPLSAAGVPAKGQELLMIGNPRTLGDWEWSRGLVGGRKGEIFRVNVNVQEGNSGGPMLLDGQVVGIVLNDLQGIAEVKSVINIRNYLEGLDVAAKDGPCRGAHPTAAKPTVPAPQVDLQVQITPAPAKLTVRSNVTGDTVFIDGQPRGPTRLDLQLSPGSNLVRVEKEGYEPFEEKVELAAGAEKTVRATLQRPGPKPGETFRDCPRCPEMVVIPTGSFQMGSPASEVGRQDDEGPVHRVQIAQPFALGRREVTVGEFGAFVAATAYRTEAEKSQGCAAWNGTEWAYDTKRNWRAPGFTQGDDHPVVCVSWNDARAYLEWLSKESGQAYRLPSEAEWEYAARAGTTTARFWAERADQACPYANVADKSYAAKYPDFQWLIHRCDDRHVHTAPVGSFKPNAFELLDILGNVWEWTEDCWNDSYNGAPSDGSAWTKGDCGRRVSRGGSWADEPVFVRSAGRFRDGTGGRGGYTGFRPARTL